MSSMSIDQLMLALTYLCASAGALIIASVIAGAFAYEVLETRAQRVRLRHPYARNYLQRPIITVLACTHNDEQDIEKRLNGIFSANYRKLQVLIIDQASRDATKRVVGRYITEHPKRDVRLIARRTDYVDNAALAAICKKHGTGQLVTVLDPDTMPAKSAFTKAVRHFNGDPDLTALVPMLAVDPQQSIAGVFRQYQAILAHRTNKLKSVSDMMQVPHDAALYRGAAFTRLYTARRIDGARRYKYADDVVLYTARRVTFRQLFGQYYRGSARQLQVFAAQFKLCLSAKQSRSQKTRAWLRILYLSCSGVLAAVTPILLGYFIYLAFGLHEPTMLLASGAIMSAMLLSAIWDSAQLKIRQKILYSFGVPVTYWLFYAVSLARLVTLFGYVPVRAVHYSLSASRFADRRSEVRIEL